MREKPSIRSNKSSALKNPRQFPAFFSRSFIVVVEMHPGHAATACDRRSIMSSATKDRAVVSPHPFFGQPSHDWRDQDEIQFWKNYWKIKIVAFRPKVYSGIRQMTCHSFRIASQTQEIWAKCSSARLLWWRFSALHFLVRMSDALMNSKGIKVTTKQDNKVILNA